MHSGAALLHKWWRDDIKAVVIHLYSIHMSQYKKQEDLDTSVDACSSPVAHTDGSTEIGECRQVIWIATLEILCSDWRNG